MRRLILLFLGSLLYGMRSAARAAPATLSPVIEEREEGQADEVKGQLSEFLAYLGAHWGNAQGEIRSTATGTIERENADSLIYSRMVADHDVLEGYQFQGGILVQGRYVVLQRPVRSINEFIDYYIRIKDAVTAIHGIPVNDHAIWNNDLYKPLPDYWGIAVMIGHLAYSTSWDTPTGHISLSLSGDHHSKLLLDYRSKDFRSREEEARNRTAPELRPAWRARSCSPRFLPTGACAQVAEILELLPL